jgi:2-polyprenyl-6-methoxyphenol hydroxylase-like FAD-dependent oxidoreductase
MSRAASEPNSADPDLVGSAKVNAGVMVIGAGPVGLLLAGELRLGGADVVVYDKLPAPTGESRALGFTRRAAEVLDQRGLLARIGKFGWGPQGHFGGVRIDLGLLKENHNGVLGLSQARTEAMLADWLEELGVPVRRGYEAVGLRETADGVVVAFDGPDGHAEDTAAYVVGCDGGRSTVRELAGIEAPGWEATRGMYTAEISGVELRPRPIGERLPGGRMVVATPLPDGRYRIVVHDRALPAHPVPGALEFGEVADAWQRLTGESIHDAKAHWMWARGNAAGLATDYRRGRVLLAGDAAHDLPPLAAWGVSAGLQDAANLGWKLAATVTGNAPEGLLDTYHSERHAVGERLMRDVQAASMLYLGGEEMEPLRDVLRELVACEDAARHLAGAVSGLGIRYDMGPGGHPLLGLRLPPDHELRLPDGTLTRVADLLHSAHGVLIAPPGSPAAETAADRVDVVTGAWAEGYDAPDEVLVRPDGYVAWTAPDGGDLAAALDRWFGPARTTAAQPASVLS